MAIDQNKNRQTECSVWRLPSRLGLYARQATSPTRLDVRPAAANNKCSNVELNMLHILMSEKVVVNGQNNGIDDYGTISNTSLNTDIA